MEEQREALIKNWNSTVLDEDTVFLMGDIAFESRKLQREFLSQLRGHKHLILGNHDNLSLGFYRQYFESIHRVLLLDSSDLSTIFVLTHIPLPHHKIESLENIFGKRVVNVHAHTHATADPDLIGDSLSFPDSYILTSAEATEYKPKMISL